MAGPNERLSKAEVVAAALYSHKTELQGFVRARVPPEEVEDVLQMAAMRAFERAESLNDSARVLPWLYRLHRNIMTDAARKRVSQQRLIDDTVPVPETCTPEPETICRCSTSQARNINARYASILSLVDMGDLTLTEAAQALGISTNNAAVCLHRARKALRKQMLEHCSVTNLRDCADCRCVYDGCCTV